MRGVSCLAISAGPTVKPDNVAHMDIGDLDGQECHIFQEGSFPPSCQPPYKTRHLVALFIDNGKTKTTRSSDMDVKFYLDLRATFRAYPSFRRLVNADI
jgi:hypothetical protein